MGVERQIPKRYNPICAEEHGHMVDMKARKTGVFVTYVDFEQRIADLAAEVETLKGLLREYKKIHRCNLNHTQWHEANRINDYRCDLCKRTDQQLQPKGDDEPDDPPCQGCVQKVDHYCWDRGGQFWAGDSVQPKGEQG